MAEIATRYVGTNEIKRLGRVGAFDAAVADLRNFITADTSNGRPFAITIRDGKGTLEFTGPTGNGRLTG